MKQVNNSAKFYIGQKVVCLNNSGGDHIKRLQLFAEYTIKDLITCQACGAIAINVGIKRKLNDIFFTQCDCGHYERVKSYFYFRHERFEDASTYYNNPEKYSPGGMKINVESEGARLIKMISSENLKEPLQIANELLEIRRQTCAPFKKATLAIDEIAEICSNVFGVARDSIIQKYQRNNNYLRLIQDAYLFFAYYYSDSDLKDIASPLQIRESSVESFFQWRNIIRPAKAKEPKLLNSFLQAVTTCNKKCPELFENNYTYSISRNDGDDLYDTERYLTEYQVDRISIKDRNWFVGRSEENRWVFVYSIYTNFTKAVKVISRDHAVHLMKGQNIGYRFATDYGWENLIKLNEEPEKESVGVNKCNGCIYQTMKKCQLALDDSQFQEAKRGNKTIYCPLTPMRPSDDVLKMEEVELQKLSTFWLQ